MPPPTTIHHHPPAAKIYPPPSSTTHHQSKYTHHHPPPSTTTHHQPKYIHHHPPPPIGNKNTVFLYENHCDSYKKLASWSRPVLFTYFFSYTYTLRFCWEIKSCCHRWFPQQTRPQITVQSYILRDCSSVRISFNMINNRHTLPIV